MKTIKQVVGIDISKDTFHVCLGIMDEKQQIQLLGQTSWGNNPTGFKELMAWCRKRAEKKLSVYYVMEATGVYYEELAYFLANHKKQFSVLLPNKAKHFAQSLDIKTKTDKVDAAMLCRIGLERALPEWKMPSPVMKEIKSLCREYKNLKSEAVRIKVRLHAYKHSYKPSQTTRRRLERQLAFLNKHMVEIEQEIREIIKQDTDLSEKTRKITKVKGLGMLTVITVIAETNGFATIENAKQLTSYAGLDVVMNQSGKHFGRTRISKKGNRHIRTALYMPAMSAVKYNERIRQFYQKIKQRNASGMVGIVAVARKLLILIYTLWKNNSEYDPNMNLSKT